MILTLDILELRLGMWDLETHLLEMSQKVGVVTKPASDWCFFTSTEACLLNFAVLINLEFFAKTTWQINVALSHKEIKKLKLDLNSNLSHDK